MTISLGLFLFKFLSGSYGWLDYGFLALTLVLFVMFFFLVDALYRVSNIESEKAQVDGMLASMHDALIAYDKDFKITLVNESLEILCNIKKEDVLGKKITPEWNNFEKYALLAKIVFPSLAPEMTRMSDNRGPSRVMIKMFKPKEYILEIVTSKVQNLYDRSFGFVKIIKDRTRENQLLKTKSDFITVAAHQLRTPLTGITWAVEVLYKKELGEINTVQEKTLKQSLDALTEMSLTIDELLKAASIEDGKFDYTFAMADIIEIINEVLKALTVKATQKNIKFVFYPPEFKVPKFVMDRDKIKTLITNLVDNAIKYNVTNGEVRIKIQQIVDKPFIKISIEDTGIGMDTVDKEKVFDKFYRSPSVLKSHTSGIGLGLYISKNIVQNHGGQIWVDSIEKRGSMFNFVLPVDHNYIPPQMKSSKNNL